MPSSADWASVTYGGGKFVAVANGSDAAACGNVEIPSFLKVDYVSPDRLQDALDGKADLDSSGKVPSSQLPDHVASINGKTGTVALTAEDVSALPNTYVAPVTSVNGQTGAVTVETGGGCTCVTATLTTAGWSASSPYAYEQTVSVAGVTTDASQYISVDVALSQTDKDANNAMLEAWNLVAQCPAKQNSGSITFYAADMPSVAISLNIGVGD